MASNSETDYLVPDFDASTLTVARLRNIFVHHDVAFPSSAKKPQLVALFNEHILPQSQKLLGKHARTKPSSKGITDVPSSQEDVVPEENSSMMPPPTTTPRPKKARKSKVPDQDAAEYDDPGMSVKKSVRKSASKIGIAKSASKQARMSDTDTSHDERIEETPARVVSTPSRPAKTARVKIEEPDTLGRKSGDPSIFSKDNPFQSGSSPSGEESVLSGEKKKRRKSEASSTETKEGGKRKSAVGGSTTTTPRRKSEKPAKRESGSGLDDGDEVSSRRSRKYEVLIPKAKREQVEAGEEFTPEEQLELVRLRAANGESAPAIYRQRKNRSTTRQSTSTVAKTAPLIVLLTLLGGYATWWRREKLAIGYCGIGHSTTSLPSADPRMPDWATHWARLLEPQCEACPQHAYCYQHLETRCDNDFVLKPHPFSLGGLVPLPPTCEADGEKAKRVKAVADRAVEELRERRAKFECGDLVGLGSSSASSSAPVGAAAGGGSSSVVETPVTVEIAEDKLKEEVGRKRRKGMSDAEFDDLWNGALGEIMGREEVVSNHDGLHHTADPSPHSNQHPSPASPSPAEPPDPSASRWLAISALFP